MSVLLQASLVLLFVAAASAAGAGVNLGPTYVLENYIAVNNTADRARTAPSSTVYSDRKYYEWESYDGWFNNPAHPEWGGAGKLVELRMTLKTSSFFFFFPFQICPWRGRRQ